MKKVSLFDNDIYKINYDFNWDLIGDFCLKSISDYRNGFVLEENEKPHYFEGFNDFFTQIKPIYENIIRNVWGLSKKHNYFIKDSWIRSAKTNEMIVEHNHGDVVAIICAYIKLPENSGMLELKNPNSDLYNLINLYPYDDEELIWKEIDLIENDVIIIPGWYYHRTQPNKSDEMRIMLAINIGIELNKNLI